MRKYVSVNNRGEVFADTVKQWKFCYMNYMVSRDSDNVDVAIWWRNLAIYYRIQVMRDIIRMERIANPTQPYCK